MSRTAAAHLAEVDTLAAYDPLRFAPVAITVDVCVLTIRDGQLCALLIERSAPPFAGRLAIPGGFIEADEDAETAAGRELMEETGVAMDQVHLEQLRTFTSPGRDPRMRVCSVAFLAFVPDPGDPVAGSDARSARFQRLDALATKRLAFDHGAVLAAAVERARSKLEWTTLATRFVAEPFTTGQLRAVYEATWGAELHPSNFDRKVRSTPGFVVETTAAPAEPAGPGRPGRRWIAGAAERLDPPLTRPVADGGGLVATLEAAGRVGLAASRKLAAAVDAARTTTTRTTTGRG